MKYELTDNTIQHDDKIFYRIRALKDFSNVKQGDLGGYLESTNNLSQVGDCWVSGWALISGAAKVKGKARVFGNAWLRDFALVTGDVDVCDDSNINLGSICTVDPIFISGFGYPITITDNNVKIGGQTHTKEKWLDFTFDDIKKINGKEFALYFFEHRYTLVALIDQHNLVLQKAQ